MTGRPWVLCDFSLTVNEARIALPDFFSISACLFLRQDPVMVPRLASISGCSCLNLLSAEITSMGHHAQQAPLLGEARATSCTSIALFHALNLEFTHIPILIVAISSLPLKSAKMYSIMSSVCLGYQFLDSPGLGCSSLSSQHQSLED